MNLSRAKINLSFGASHMIRKSIYFTLSTATFSQTKLVSLPSFSLLNFLWTSMSPTTGWNDKIVTLEKIT